MAGPGQSQEPEASSCLLGLSVCPGYLALFFPECQQGAASELEQPEQKLMLLQDTLLQAVALPNA